MRVVLDTDVCSYLLKRSHPALEQRVRRHSPGELSVSAITVFELQYGARRLDDPDRWLDVIDAFTANLEVLPLDAPAMREAAAIRADLARRGNPIGAYDLLIAGHTRALGAMLVTNNVRELGRVEGLRVESWIDG